MNRRSPIASRRCAMLDQSTLTRLRRLCLALPDATEKETWEAPTFRVRDKIFAMVHAHEGAPSIWCKAPPGAQTILVHAAPERFFAPPYVGPKGWIGIRLDAGLDWAEAAELITRSYRMTAPKRLLARLPPSEPGVSSPADKPAARSRRKSLPSLQPMRRTRSASEH